MSNEFDQALPSILDAYPCEWRSGGRIEPVTPGFSGARVWKVITRTGTFALRAWPNPAPPPDRLRGLHDLLRQIAATGLSVLAVPETANNGQTWIEQRGRVWQLETWMPGVADFHSQPGRERLRNAMRTLAQFHRASARVVPASSASPWFFQARAATPPAVTRRLEWIHRWRFEDERRLHRAVTACSDSALRELAIGCLRDFHRAADRVHAELSRFADSPFRLQPCLRDIWHDHLLFTGDEVTGLVDPAAAATDHVATDLARLLGSLVRDERAQWEAALDDYRNVAPLSDLETSLVFALDRAGALLSPMTWLERFFLSGRSPELSEAAVRRWIGLAGRLHHLAWE